MIVVRNGVGEKQGNRRAERSVQKSNECCYGIARLTESLNCIPGGRNPETEGDAATKEQRARVAYSAVQPAKKSLGRRHPQAEIGTRQNEV